MTNNILVFGDSISWGEWDFEKGGWVDRLKTNLSKNRVYTYNLGIPADTSKLLLERFRNELTARWEEKDGKLIIIFAVGINDSIFRNSPKNVETSKEKFQNNIKELINKARTFTDNILFLGLTKVEESKVQPLPGSSTGKSFSNSLIQEYNKIIKSICKKENLEFIDIFELLDYSNLHDGLHPNSKGHEKIFNKVKDHLIKY